MDFFYCRTPDEAQELISRAVANVVLPREPVALENAFGRILAVDVVSNDNVPPFSRSTVDGYAVNSADTFGAGETAPTTLSIVGEILMGEAVTACLAPGEVMAIPTGAMLPVGADAVLMLEHSQKIDDGTLLVLRALAPGENMVMAGEDIARGELLLARGTKIGAAEIGALAACGFYQVKVFKQLTVGIISTGDEIVEPMAKPIAGQIRDVNSYALAAAVTQRGYIAKRYGIIPDVYAGLHECLARAVEECDMVLVSGGSSVGTRDYTIQALEALSGRDVLLHGVAIKPGKPTIFTMVGNVALFGLPGHPVSALTVFERIVRKAAEEISGEVVVGDGLCVRARITRNVPSAAGREDIIRVKLKREGDGYVAEPVFGKSGLISTLIKADARVRIAPHVGGLYAGDEVEAVWLRS